MRSIIFAIATGATALMLSTASVAQNSYGMTPEEVRERIRVLQSSVTESSVTERFTDEQRQAKLDLLQQAEIEVYHGEIGTAIDLVIQTGRMLYPVDLDGGTPLDEAKRNQWLRQVNKVIEAILPAAYDIAREKGASTKNLEQISSYREKGVAAWSAQNIDRAEMMLAAAYNQLQTEIAGLRSGDLLTIELPDTNTREAWEEAERRFLDWRFTADWMQHSAAAMDADPELIATGSRLADELYQEASALAAGEKWAEAVDKIDQAYTVMEEHWRTAGIDI